MKLRKWSSLAKSTRIRGLLERSTAEPRPYCIACWRAVLTRYSVIPGRYRWRRLYGTRSAMIERTCRRVSQLAAFWYVSARDFRYLSSAGFSASQRPPASSGIITSRTATTASLALATYTFLVRGSDCWLQGFLGCVTAVFSVTAEDEGWRRPCYRQTVHCYWALPVREHKDLCRLPKRWWYFPWLHTTHQSCYHFCLNLPDPTIQNKKNEFV